MPRLHTKEAAETLLRELPSVLGAFVREDINGHPREIHLLVSPGPNVKLLAQDVRDLLEERLEVPIDHRIISIAQLAEDLDFNDDVANIEPQLEPRLRFVGTESEVRDQKVRVRTKLQARSETIEGEASEIDVGSGRMRAATIATLRATGRAISEPLRLEVEFVSVVRAFDREYVLVAVVVGGAPFGRKLLNLAGAQPIEHDVETAAALATLKAVNRLLAKMI